MGKARKLGAKRGLKRKVGSRYSSSNDSDEDFVLENEEIASEDDDVVNSLDGYASEESFWGSVKGGVQEVFRKASRAKRGRGSDKSAGGNMLRKKKTVSCEENGHDEDEDYVVTDDEEDVDVDEYEDVDVVGGIEQKVFRKASRAKRGRGSDKNAGGNMSRKKKGVSCEKNGRDDDEDYMVDDDDENADVDEDEDVHVEGGVEEEVFRKASRVKRGRDFDKNAGGNMSRFKKPILCEENGRDDDEDYVVDDDEEDVDDDEYEDVDIEGGVKKKAFRKACRAKRGRRSDKNAGGNMLRNKKAVSCEINGQDDDEDYVVDDDDIDADVDEDEDVHDEEGVEEEVFKKASGVKWERDSDKNAGGNMSRFKKTVSCEENGLDDDEDYVVDDEDVDEDEEYLAEDDEEEFTPEEEDNLVDEEEGSMEEKNSYVKVGKRSMQKRSSAKGTRRRNSSISKKPSILRTRRLRKKQEFDLNDEDDADLFDSIPVCTKESRIKKTSRSRYVVDSDSDFTCSRSSDFEYTISDEEREQVKEASKLFGDLKSSLRNSSSTRGIPDNCDISRQKHSVRNKGKDKAKEVKGVVKQVCGICLSEEDKRRSRGTLNCCSHYFCFACIMEWSKVESRCPLCKQRFKAITKHGRSTMGVDLRNMVFEVPKRDQVYQPTEDEIRSFVDPYESVICTECHEGGDDGLMLLCDICDSPAHTYCVGLGRQVPEGNWYCDGCRPVALGSSSTPAQDSSSVHRTTENSLAGGAPLLTNLGESSEPMIESSFRLAFPQGISNVPSLRFPVADGPTISQVSGSGAATLSVRRQIHRHIQNMMISNRMVYLSGRPDMISAASLDHELINSRVEQNQETATPNSRTHEFGMLQSFLMGERLLARNLSFPVTRNNSFVSSRQSQFGSQVMQDPTMVTTDRRENLTLWPELSATNSVAVNEQVRPYDIGSGVGLDCNLPANGRGEENQFYGLKEQLKSMVKRHLMNLSQDIHLGNDTFSDIQRSSTHTILAALGQEHKRSEVQMVPTPAKCTHFVSVAAGETSMMKGFCSSCFDSFVRDVVKGILDTRLPQWLSLGL